MTLEPLKSIAANDGPKLSIWEGCYELQWSGVISKESFAHPAKFSRGLIERIYDYCLAEGYLLPGDLVGDPFGGIGTGGITAAYRGLQWVGHELEPRFVKLALDNIELHRSRLVSMGRPLPVIWQGDSRQFHKKFLMVAGAITSPPFSAAGAQPPNMRAHCPVHSKFKNEPDRIAANSERQLGNIETLKSGAIDGAITSPPYADIAAGAGGLNSKPARRPGQQCGRRGGGSQDAIQRYGVEAGQISRLKGGTIDAAVTSPPYAKSLRAQQDGIDWEKAKQNGEAGQNHGKGKSCHADYGQESQQIAALPAGNIDGAVTSPPYEGSGKGGPDYQPGRAKGTDSPKLTRDSYGDSTGQIGRDTGETYWQAMKAVYGSCWLAIKPGGVLVVVVKDYVAKKQRVRLCDDTCRLLEHVGFVVVERIKAMLVSESVHSDLFAGETTVKKERKSFFRRLAEKKGSPKIDFEEVIIAVRSQRAGPIGGIE